MRHIKHNKGNGACYENLASAIILQAAEDYRVALRENRMTSKDELKDPTIPRLERFFRSKWFTALTTIDGEWLMNRLQKEVKES